MSIWLRDSSGTYQITCNNIVTHSATYFTCSGNVNLGGISSTVTTLSDRAAYSNNGTDYMDVNIIRLSRLHNGDLDIRIS